MFFVSIVPFAIVNEFFGSSFGKGQIDMLMYSTIFAFAYDVLCTIMCIYYIYTYMHVYVRRYGSMNVYVLLDMHAYVCTFQTI